MDNVFILSVNDRIIGVYTSHRKATQEMFMDTLPFNYQLTDYSFEFGVEFFTFTDKALIEKTYTIQEATLDQRA